MIEGGLAKHSGIVKILFSRGLFPGKKCRLAGPRPICVNYIPDEEPFNAQTPTKFLEYAAMKIPVISTNYFWISEFQERYGGNYFFLKEDLSNMTWDRITGFPYEFPNLEKLALGGKD